MIDAIEAALDQGLLVLGIIEQDLYTRPSHLGNGATIGGHYRHGLEHFRQLLEGLSTGTVDYDARERDHLLESDREEAVAATRRLKSALRNLSSHGSEDPLEIRCGITCTRDEAGAASSTLGREIIFCIGHAIHHYAIIAMILRSEGRIVPEGFGVAPSTLKHRAEITRSR